jgi:hypothetical protein
MVGDALEITVLQLPKFKTEAMALVGADGIIGVAVYLISHPDAGRDTWRWRSPEIAMGGEGQREARWCKDHLLIHCDRRAHLPAPLLHEER